MRARLIVAASVATLALPTSAALSPEEVCDDGRAIVAAARIALQTDEYLFCADPRADIGDPDQSHVAVWEAGAAPWSRDTAVKAAGLVVVKQRSGDRWSTIRTLVPTSAVAYGRFGAQLAVNSRWLGVLHAGPQRVYVYDRRQLELPPTEVADAAAFAESIVFSGETLIVGGKGLARAYRSTDKGWNKTESVEAPAGATGVFQGQIAATDRILVSMNEGLNLGDGGVMPGRVDVFRRSQSRWVWEARLVPSTLKSTEPFGSRCCVSIEGDSVHINIGKSKYVFISQGGSWRQKEGDAK